GTDPGTFQISRTGSLANPLSVFYNLSGTALNGDDYASLTGVVIVPAGQASATLQVNPIDDSLAEDSETVVAAITPDYSYTIGSPSSATVTIFDGIADPDPDITIRD